ncbi:MAG: hypothetical protein JJE13_05340 [Thermoleophilia bacterium]|nr:hypothetical protein [Thermoleophilia bacterium]
MTAAEPNLPPTGVAGSDLERQAAKRLADALRQRGRSVSVESVSVRISEGSGVAIHALLALAGGLIGLKWPLIGAAIILIAAFSFYAERSLGLPLIGRLVPTRASQNVMSPPPGPAWQQDVEIVLTAGYDLPASYPTGEWLSRRFSGRLTTDRIVLWGGMVPVFVAVMLGAANVEGSWVSAIQLIGSVVLLSMVAAQVDRGLATDAEADEADLKATDNLLAVLDEAIDESDGDPPIAICFFGAETGSAQGAAAFFKDFEGILRAEDAAVINFVNGSAPGPRLTRKARVLITAKEGDLASMKMNDEMGSESPIKPEPAILRTTTAATIARRRGLRSTTVVGSGDDAVDVGLDLIDNSAPVTE